MNGEELTEQETALYDRQIRVWGADAQRRLSKSHILVYGMKGTAAEFDVGDDRAVTEDALSSNFLILPDENVCAEKTVAELCCNSLKVFNPMVRVSVEKGDLSSFGGDFSTGFVVIVSCCTLMTKKSINEKCRKLSKRVAFYTVDCRNSCGEIFVDLQKHIYTKFTDSHMLDAGINFSTLENTSQESVKALLCYERSVQYMEELPILSSPFAVIERFEEAEGRNPGEISIEDLPAVLKLKKEICEAQARSLKFVI
ncbi:hypothetical protein GH714_024522 [Hevea brasiliensis]|uniref:THIF-type NAD/FAD binding fold domain-containing protein n=1 Tax=Hevea brasiliensis TaxID=3981 RepID=A0A6A6MHM8_HEVBR|nr:hypothetical protein GH714_024522 [Hevea brasiliensis]